MSIPYLACIVAASAAFHLPPRVLPSIEAVEGGRVGMVHLNSNGTADLGVMQVNTIWIKPLADASGTDMATATHLLIDNPCSNIRAAAWIMHIYMQETHNNVLRAVAYYHSHTAPQGAAYLERVEWAAARLFTQRR